MYVCKIFNKFVYKLFWAKMRLFLSTWLLSYILTLKKKKESDINMRERDSIKKTNDIERDSIMLIEMIS